MARPKGSMGSPYSGMADELRNSQIFSTVGTEQNLEDLKVQEESRKAKESTSKSSDNKSAEGYKKTKFHNFNETFTQYSAEELDRIIEKSQREKFR